MEESNIFRAITTRRSVRRYQAREVPDDILRKLLELSNRAPSGFNLQPWYFIVVKDYELRQRLQRIAMNQPQVTGAPLTVVFVADPAAWKTTFASVLRISSLNGTWDAARVERYQRLVRLTFALGPWGIAGFLKRLALPLMRLRRPYPRMITSSRELLDYVSAQTMLAAENFMIGARGFGLDTCAMEGFDEYRIKRLLAIPAPMTVPMIVTLGYGAEDSNSGESVRLPVESKTFLNKFTLKFFE